MILNEIKRAILQALRDGRPHNLFELANEIDHAPFNVNAELRALRREQLVRDTIGIDAHNWTLTDRGWRLIYNGDQLELT